MTKNITVAERQTRDSAEKKYTVDWIWGIVGVGIACWMNMGMWYWNTS